MGRWRKNIGRTHIVCSKCRENKPVSEFPVMGGKQVTTCRTCLRARDKVYRAEKRAREKLT